MKNQGLSERLAAVVKASGRNMKHISLRAGLGETFVRDVIAGRSSAPQVDKLRRLADELGVTLDQLMGAGPNTAAEVELIGFVGAGAEIFPFDGDGPLRRLAAPPGLREGFAVDVRGDSMLPVYRPGDRLFAHPVAVLDHRIEGRDCVVDVRDGRRLVKRVRRGDKRGTWRLFSYHTMEESPDLRLDRAAVIVWVRRA